MNRYPKSKKAAHFLLLPELLYSPPNKAIIKAYLENNYEVDVYTPGFADEKTKYGRSVRVLSVSYSWIWLIRNILDRRWLKYFCFSGTSEDPLAIVGVLSYLYMKKCFSLVDEIKAGSYRGDRSDKWKELCKWTIRRSEFQIVNDEHRKKLLREYARIEKRDTIVVYPGCFDERPYRENQDRESIRKYWGVPSDAFIIGSSGGFNMTAGADWLIKALNDYGDIYSVIQPLGVSALTVFLLSSLSISNRIFIEPKRLDWEDAWISAQGLDIGMCIYSNPAPQFQNMGISSNRLCMFLAMGVPVIASKQKSFQFIEEFDCGRLVNNYSEFKDAIEYIRNRHKIMKLNCNTCFNEYIMSKSRYHNLVNLIEGLSLR